MITDSEPARSRRGPISRLALWLAALALAGLAVPVLARLLGIEWGPLAYVVSLMPWATLALLVPLAIALALRSWPLVGVAGAMLALCLAWLAPLYVGSGGGGDPALTVATVNLGFGNGDADAVVALVRDHHIELLSLQELTPASLDALEQAGLDELLPYRDAHAESGYTGAGLWSAYPLSDATTLDGFHSQATRALVQTPAGVLTVYAIHPVAPGPRFNTMWRSELELLATELGAATGPVIIAGDFNATRDHRGFRALEALGYVDAANEAGAGFQPTFPQDRFPIALVAIDHVMTRDAPIRAIDVRTVAIPGADHRALIVVYGAR
ncbi:MAG: endonuclease [Actinobacteria bacterium HGW-Actinobacteria-4]|nr:MAG: endonuclease [Actinobacteria bacterium HGW-Actinobacteria-4]